MDGRGEGTAKKSIGHPTHQLVQLRKKGLRLHNVSLDIEDGVDERGQPRRVLAIPPINLYANRKKGLMLHFGLYKLMGIKII